MDPLSQSWQFFLDWFENISLLVVLVLLYNFIPDRFFIRRDRTFSIYVGLIFTFAAVLGILIPWGGTSHPAIGINGVLVPLAGLVGGPVSACIITFVLLITRIPVLSNSPELPDILIIIIAGIIGSCFYIIREKRILKLTPYIELFSLSSVFAVITIVVMTLTPRTDLPTPPDMAYAPTFEVPGIIFAGLFLLGFVIRAIDSKKDNEYELLTYKEHLEALVHERTAALERINSLQKATIESTTDGIIVIGTEGQVNSFNRAGAFILKIPPDYYTSGRELNIFSLLDDLILNTDKIELARDTIHQHPEEPLNEDVTFRNGRTYMVSVTPCVLEGEIFGHVFNFRDMTERIHAEDAIKSANQKLILLSGITRHDILNQITALNLYLNLVIDDTTDTAISEYLNKMNHLLQTMEEQIKFTSDYQDIGLHEPVWQNLELVFQKAADPFNDKGITFSSVLSGYEVYTDPLLERVFYNLIDNSLRHGDHVSKISLSDTKSGNDLMVLYQDNGAGVKPDEKEKIFQKGFGKHTGFGMFLIHEILSITGISIRETGIYGKGVRFEICIPEGSYRKSDQK